MNFRDVGVKKMDEAFSRDKMWRVRKIFCLIYCSNSYGIKRNIINFLVLPSVLNLLSLHKYSDVSINMDFIFFSSERLHYTNC